MADTGYRVNIIERKATPGVLLAVVLYRDQVIARRYGFTSEAQALEWARAQGLPQS